MLKHLKVFFSFRKTVAVGIAFFLLGFLFGNWATLIPYVKYHYELDDAQLGLILLCLPMGAMSFNPFASVLIQSFGLLKITVIGMFLLCIAYAIPIGLNNIYILPFSLVFVGIAMTTLNISANTTATTLERLYDINIMSTCHGMFSIGLMVGSLMRSVTLIWSIHESTHMYIMSIIGLILTWSVMSTIMNIPIEKLPLKKVLSNKKWVLIIPKGALLNIVIISLCINMTEGAMTDWTSVYMKDIVHSSPYFVGWGLFGYSFFMALGRFFGDGIIPLYGKNSVLVYGSFLSIVGLFIVIFFPFTVSTIIGFGCIGLGVSCGAPILYGSASRYPDLPDSGGLAVMNTFAMGGFLIGPVIIGFISEITSLPIAFGFVGLLTLVWMVQAKYVKLY